MKRNINAKKLLKENTIGYKNHTPLEGFKNAKETILFINNYSFYVWIGANQRIYNFDKTKFNYKETNIKINVKTEQITHERELLLSKLLIRDKILFENLKKNNNLEINLIFNLIHESIVKWEKIKK